MKMVIRDYMAAFRLSRIKERYGSNFFGMFYLGIYLVAIMPTAVLGQNGASKYIAEYYVLVCLLLFCMYSSQLHPIEMSKLLYLCPMSRQERREYLLKSYLLKIGVIFVASALGLILILNIGKLNLIYATLFLCANMGLAISSSLMNAKRIRACIDKRKSVVMSSGADGRETAAIIVSICLALFLLICVDSQEEMQGVVGVVIALVLLVVELPLVITMLKRVRPTIEQAMNYEN